MKLDALESDFLRYLVGHSLRPGDRLPSLGELSSELGVSVNKLREQMEVARSLGLVDVRPRVGMRVAEYSFLPAIRLSLMSALAGEPGLFPAFSELRNHLEAAFWHEAVSSLTAEDVKRLQDLVDAAWARLEGDPIQIPHQEHRDLHLVIFSRLGNPFVAGLLEAYWEAYEAVGLNVYSDLSYLREVWTYHARIVKAIAAQDFDAGYRLLNEHTGLIHHREK